MNASFKITVDVFQDNKRVDKIEVTQDVSESKETVLKKEVLELKVPYAPALKGKVSFDIIVKDLSSSTSYKRLLHYKY